MPFLQYDAAEIPDFLAFLLLGPTGGVAVAAIHWLALVLQSSFDPLIGPTMKFLAVFASMAGLYVGTRLLPRMPSLKRALATLTISTVLFRTILMIVPTFALYYLISPSLYLPFATNALAVVGLHVEGILAGALLVTVVTAVFNVTQAIFSVVATWIVYRSVSRVTLVDARSNWFRYRVSLSGLQRTAPPAPSESSQN